LGQIIDKETQKEVQEMYMLEEYDLENKSLRPHKMFFVYVDGSKSYFKVESGWNDAVGGSEANLNFLIEN